MAIGCFYQPGVRFPAGTKIGLSSRVCVCVCSSVIITCAMLRHSVECSGNYWKFAGSLGRGTSN